MSAKHLQQPSVQKGKITPTSFTDTQEQNSANKPPNQGTDPPDAKLVGSKRSAFNAFIAKKTAMDANVKILPTSDPAYNSEIVVRTFGPRILHLVLCSHIFSS